MRRFWKLSGLPKRRRSTPGTRSASATPSKAIPGRAAVDDGRGARRAQRNIDRQTEDGRACSSNSGEAFARRHQPVSCGRGLTREPHLIAAYEEFDAEQSASAEAFGDRLGDGARSSSATGLIARGCHDFDVMLLICMWPTGSQKCVSISPLAPTARTVSRRDSRIRSR